MTSRSSRISRKLSLLARIEIMRLKLAGKHLGKQAAFVALAILLGVGGIGMMMLCLYIFLAMEFGPMIGAFVTGLILFALAAAAILYAGKAEPEHESQMLDQMQETVLQDLQSDFDVIEQKFSHMENAYKAFFGGDLIKLITSIFRPADKMIK